MEKKSIPRKKSLKLRSRTTERLDLLPPNLHNVPYGKGT